jgi:hypothetical protein
LLAGRSFHPVRTDLAENAIKATLLGLPHLSGVVIDTDEKILQNIFRQNPGILWQRIDERIAVMLM